MLYRISFIILSFILYSCAPGNYYLTPEYKNKTLTEESLMVVQIRVTPDSNYVYLTETGDENQWKKAFFIASKPLIKYYKADSLEFIPDLLQISKEILKCSTLDTVVDYTYAIPSLTRQSLSLKEDSVEIFLPSGNFSLKEIPDSLKYILFIQLPEEVLSTNSKLYINLIYCFWDIPKSKVMSYGKVTSVSGTTPEDVALELAKEIITGSPFRLQYDGYYTPYFNIPKMPEPPKPVIKY